MTAAEKIDGYKVTIGLEIHAQLKTKTKLFSNSPNLPIVSDPNSIVSPIDAAHPGTLPALNYEAVKKVIEVGLAIDGNIAEYTEWDRKNYFYPDIPKAYQISQYKYPLVTGGSIAGYELTRIHLEEDTGKSIHDEGEYSLVDLNRAGMPLMELVTEPVIHSASEAARFAKEFQLLLRYLDVSDANLEKGEMRVEVNVSVSKNEILGTKVEVKNLNSFKSVENAINFEVARHIDVLESGGELVQETRGWDENGLITFSQRAKEDAHDYRYFPDPDIPKLYVSEVFNLEQMKSEIPVLPAEIRAEMKGQGFKNQQIDMFVNDPILYKFMNDVKSISSDKVDVTKVANFITSNVLGALIAANKDISEVDNYVNQVADIILLIADNQVSSTGADTLLNAVIVKENDTSIDKLVDELSLRQSNNEDEIIELAKSIISDFPEQVAEYKAGNENLMKFLMGQAMKRSKGKANPQILTKVIQNEIR